MKFAPLIALRDGSAMTVVGITQIDSTFSTERENRCLSYGGPTVRIHLSPAESQVRTCLSREFAFLRREAAVFRGCAGRSERRGRQRRAGHGNIGPTAVISLSGYIPVPHRRWVIFEFGSGSGKTERGPLIEWRAQPRRAETDVDLVDAHLDPFDQGSEDSTLAGHGQLGPVLADVCGARDKPLLH